MSLKLRISLKFFQRYKSECEDGSDNEGTAHYLGIFIKGYCLKILKSLYNLKQAPRNWNYLLKEFIKFIEYQQCALDQCLFVHKGAGNQLNMILVCVDDIIVLSTDDVHIDEVVTAFKTQYAMQDLGDLQHYLARFSYIIRLHIYAKDVVARFNLLLSERKRRCKAVTPLPPDLKLTKESKEAETNRQREYAKAFPYQSVIGALMYSAVPTRPDIAYKNNSTPILHVKHALL